MSRDFYGLPTRTLANKHVRLDYLTTAGPRIVRLTLVGSDDNLFAEVADIKIPTPYGDYSLFGGHRLWHSPEAMPRTYMPDNDAPEVTDLPDGVRRNLPRIEFYPECESHKAAKGNSQQRFEGASSGLHPLLNAF